MIFPATNFFAFIRHPLLTLRFRRKVGYWPNVATPGKLNELIHWRKIFNHDPMLTRYVDKLDAKTIVQERCPELNIPPTLWRGTDARQLPEKFNAPGFVIKTNHGSSSNYFPHRELLPHDKVVRYFEKRLSRTFGVGAGEWAYRNVRPELFVEPLIEPAESGSPLMELSVWVVAGKAVRGCVYIHNKTPARQYRFVNLDGSTAAYLPANAKSTLPENIDVPNSYPEAVRRAEQIAGQQDYLRVDYLCSGDDLYFSEITVYPAAGFGKPDPKRDINDTVPWLKALDSTWFLTTRQSFPVSVYQRALRQKLAAGDRAA
ncbi:MAG: hypothetical protein GXP01_06805 [Alphaproteobacteria bacterium]|nr:hypothetical protein [Alphaproteobacteria bacterium]